MNSFPLPIMVFFNMQKARSLGIQTVRVKIKGMGPGRNVSVKKKLSLNKADD